MNLGSIGGPTDGSSEVSRAMESFAQPGRILVCGVGDDGGQANRAVDSLSTGDTLEISFRKAELGIYDLSRGTSTPTNWKSK